MSPLQGATPSSKRKAQCKAKSKRSGRQCTNPPIRGGTVCRMHGGAAPQVRAKAEEQLRLARDELMEMLLSIARDATHSASDRLKAITWGLERAGFKGGLNLDINGDIKVNGYINVLAGLFAESEEDEAAREIEQQPEGGNGSSQAKALEAMRLEPGDDILPANARSLEKQLLRSQKRR